MREQKNDIGKLFSEGLAYYRAQDPANDLADWMAIDNRLNKISFFKFSLSKFNIFYASLIAGTFLITAAIGLDYFVFSPANEKQQIESAPLDSSVENNPALPDTLELDIQEHEIRTSLKTNKKNEGRINQSLPSTLQADKDADTIIKDSNKTHAKVAVDTMKPSVNKPDEEVKKVIIVKQPSVIVRDTVYQSKKSTRFNKKNP